MHSTPTRFASSAPAGSYSATSRYLVSVLGKLLLDLVVHLGGLLGLGQVPPCSLLALVVCLTLDLPSLLEPGIIVSHVLWH